MGVVVHRAPLVKLFRNHHCAQLSNITITFPIVGICFPFNVNKSEVFFLFHCIFYYIKSFFYVLVYYITFHSIVMLYYIILYYIILYYIILYYINYITCIFYKIKVYKKMRLKSSKS